MVKLREYPEEGELVVVTVRDVKPFGAFVALDEDPGREGFIHVAAVATGWVKYIRDFVRENQKAVCKVLSVNEAKGHVDLSLKQVNEHQRRDKIQEWKNECRADKLFEIVCQQIGIPMEQGLKEFGYKLIETYGSLYSAFENVAINSEILEQDGFKGNWIPVFRKVAAENIMPPLMTISGTLELTNFTSNGIEHIKKALMLAEESKGCKIVVQYLGAPRYKITATAIDYKTAEEELKKSAEIAIAYNKKNKGDGKFIRKE
ncbi:MAG: translation initiation factor IF-2 subunit alpha [Thermoplasmata archaeon]